MKNDIYEYHNVMDILRGFLEALKENVILYEGDLILYHNPYEVKTSFWVTLGNRLRDFKYTEDESMEITEMMSLMAMALESNLISSGLEARNPTWCIYLSKVKYGYQEGSSDTADKFIAPSEQNLSEAEILQAAEQKQTKLIEVKEKLNK